MYSFLSPSLLLAALVTVAKGLVIAQDSLVAARATAPTARTVNGTYVGAYVPEYKQDFFLGVPYAQAPVGDLRFRTPQSLDRTFAGNKKVTQYSAECVGYGGDDTGYALSEDCLYLNVIRPSSASYDYSSSGPLPVGLWIHGGGYFMGGGPDKRYNLSFIVENSVAIGQPFIGVSINYRLSAWGFLASDDVTGSGDTNLGLRDQRLAMQWVQENIAAFGGDPKKVTIWGESAGASSVGFHLVAYNGRNDGLFRAAIMESGSPVPYRGMYGSDYYEPQYQAIVNNVGCSEAIDSLECLRGVPYDALNAAINTSNSSNWFPYVDGDFIAKYPSIQLADGDFVKVPIISGANTDEGTAFAVRGLNTSAQLLASIESSANLPYVGLPSTLAQEILAAYPDNPCVGIPTTLGCTRLPASLEYGLEFRRSAAYYGDVVFIASRRQTCQTWAANGVSAYCYRFNAIPNGLDNYIAATHFQEVSFVFINLNGVGYDNAPDPFAGKPPSYTALAYLMGSSWASFIHSLDPNAYRVGNTSVALWPQYNVKSPENFVFSVNVTSHAEADTWRAKGIALINKFSVAYQR